MAVRAVVFDIGGVLEYTPDLDVRGSWERRLGLPACAIGERLADVWRAGSLGEITEADVHTALRERLDCSGERAEELMADVWREYLGSANTELIDYARDLRTRVRTGILSNSFVGAREREQAAYGLAELTDVVVYSHEVGLAKPDPASYRLACERLGVAPEEAVFLDDVPMAVDAARECGMHAVLFRDNEQAMAAIEELLRAPSGSPRSSG